MATKKDKTSLKIQNIVATTSLGKDVPLTKLAKTVPNTEYNPEQFPGLVLRVKEPKSAVLVFSSGNLVCTGTKSTAQVRKVVIEVIKKVAGGNARSNLSELLNLKDTRYQILATLISRTQAELIWADNSSYANLCASDSLNNIEAEYGTKLASLEDDIEDRQGGTLVMKCQAGASTYCISAQMVSDDTKYFCVDSDGRVADDAASTVCTATSMVCE